MKTAKYKFKSKMKIKVRLIIFLAISILGCKQQLPKYEEEKPLPVDSIETPTTNAEQMLATFYTAYIKEFCNENGNTKPLKEKYLTPELQTRIENGDWEYDPILYAEDNSEESWMLAFNIEPDIEENMYTISYTDRAHAKKSIKLSVVNKDGKWFINDIIDHSFTSPDNLYKAKTVSANNISKYEKPLKYYIVSNEKEDNKYSNYFLNTLYEKVEYYINNSKQELLKTNINDANAVLGYSIDAKKKKGHFYYLIGIYNESKNKTDIIQWIYLTEDLEDIFEYDLPNDKLIKFNL